MNIHNLERIFPPPILQRGIDYYERNKILEYRSEDNQVIAVVKGSGDNFYHVSFEIDSQGNIVDHDCDCPYGGLCKHLAALMLYRKNRPEVMINPLKNAQDKPPTLLQPKSFSKTPMPDNKLSGTRHASAQPERWSLFFILTEANSTFGLSYLTLKPAMRFIRQDGFVGRSADFRSDKITESVSQAAQILLDYLQENLKNPPSFALLWDYIHRNPDLPIFDKSGNPMDFQSITQFEITFTADTIGHNLETVYYRYDLSCKAGMDVWSNLLSPVASQNFHFALNEYFYQDKNEKYWHYHSENPHFSSFMMDIRKTIHFTADEIDNLINRYQKELKGIVMFDFDQKPMVILSPVPKAVIEIPVNFTLRNRSVPVSFLYDKQEVLPSNNSEYLKLPDDDSGNIHMIRRQRALENQTIIFISHLIDKLCKEHQLELIKIEKNYYGIDAYQFIQIFGTALLEEGFDLRLSNTNSYIRKTNAPIRVRIKNGIDWFDLETYLDTGVEDDHKGASVSSYDERLFKSGKDYLIVGQEEMEAFSRLKKLGFDDSGRLRLQSGDLGRIAAVSEYTADDITPEFVSRREIAEKLCKTEQIDPVETPSGFNAELRNYQKAGLDWLYFLWKNGLNGLLADDMGLGKTVQALALILKIKQENPALSCLFVVPVTTLPNWEAEIARFTPGLTFYRHHGQGRVKEDADLSKSTIVLVSYHTLRNDLKIFQKKEWNCLLLDEAQTIKNADSQAFKAIRSIKASFKLSLTGTPVENRTAELWSQMDFLYPGLLGGKKEFATRFAKPIEENADRDASSLLKRLISPFVLRRKKEDVAKDLPQKEEIILSVEMEPDQKAVYEKIRAYYSGKVHEAIDDKGIERSAIAIFEGLLKLRQAALFPELLGPEYSGITSCKFEAVKRLITEAVDEGHKILLFSQFVQTLRIIEEHLIAEGLKYSYLDGKSRDRGGIVKQFQEDSEVKIFLISLKAGGVGINLTAADYVILFDPWWNPAVEQQAVDRSHRIGQDKKVIVYKPIVQGTVEEKILELQSRKKALVNDLITEEAGIFKNLKREDILELFGESGVKFI